MNLRNRLNRLEKAMPPPPPCPECGDFRVKILNEGQEPSACPACGQSPNLVIRVTAYETSPEGLAQTALRAQAERQGHSSQ